VSAPERSGLLAGRSVVITGAGSGIGRASALLFAREGAQVVCADVREEWVNDTAALVAAEGGTAVARVCDVTHQEQVAEAVQQAVRSFGRLDVMFNNAGISSPRRGMLLEDHTEADFDHLVAVNGKGVFFGCVEAVQRFKEQGDGGAIVNTGSIAGMVGWGSAVYGGTKGMVIQMTRALALEVAPAHIRVNCICPGGMMTNFSRPESDAFKPPTPAELEGLARIHPLGEVLTAEQCASAALFLASDLSANITGVALPVDGGYLTR
jgi:NAD(P)-dependent dehydrogenase (short-subunit alcohol dehydrogenase family)